MKKLALRKLSLDKVKHKYIPLAYALIFAPCLEIMLFSINSYRIIYAEYYSFSYLSIILTVFLISLVYLIVGDFKKLMTEPFILVLAGIILLGLLSATEVMLAICLMVLGYSQNRKVLIYIGILLMPIKNYEKNNSYINSNINFALI